MKVAVLGSGSAGNSVLVSAGGASILVDAGFSGRELERRLEKLGYSPDTVSAIFITHDHGDHTRGMGVFARRHATPLYMTEATRIACSRLLRGSEDVRTYRAGFPVEIGPFRIDPFLTVHDAAEPVAVSVMDVETEVKLGVATDLGRPTAQVRLALSRCDFLILEANHDEELLYTSPYPHSVKRRIASSHGHLSNHAAARFAEELFHPRLSGVLLAHLSQECNRPDLARKVVEDRLRSVGFRGYLDVAPQDEPTPLLDIPLLRERLDPSQLDLW